MLLFRKLCELTEWIISWRAKVLFLQAIDIFYFLISPHQGYHQREAFILTQAPLKNTIQDFWRMLWEYEVYSVVMISSAKERDMVSSQSIYLVGLKQIVPGLLPVTCNYRSFLHYRRSTFLNCSVKIC